MFRKISKSLAITLMVFVLLFVQGHLNVLAEDDVPVNDAETVTEITGNARVKKNTTEVKTKKIKTKESRSEEKTIAQIFPDQGLAEGVAKNLAGLYGYDFDGTTVDSVLTQEMIDAVTSLELGKGKNQTDKKEIVDLTGISVLTSLNKLTLDGNGLTEIPEELLSMKQLTFLSVNGNKLTSIPSDIDKLSNLEYFSFANSTIAYANRNNITSLPDSIGNFTNLIEFNGNESGLISLPDSIGNLASLEYFNCSDNNLTSIPDSIGNLANLTHIVLSNNPDLSGLPSTMSNLKKLEQIFVDLASLTEIPAFVTELPALTEISMHTNKINTISEELFNLISTKFDGKTFYKQHSTVDIEEAYKQGEDATISGHPILSQTYAYTGSDSPFTYELTDPSGNIVDITADVFPIASGSDIVIPKDKVSELGKYTLTTTAKEGQIFYRSRSRFNSIYTWNFEVEKIIDLMPTLEVEPFKEVALGNSYDPKGEIIEASDDIDELTIDNVVISGDVVDVNKAGIYVVDFALDDTNPKTDTAVAKQVVLVNDGSFVVDGNYIINANDFTVSLSEANLTTDQIAEHAGVRVYDIIAQQWLVDPVLTIDNSLYQVAVGAYDVTFSFNPSITIVATVIADPVIPQTGIEGNGLYLYLGLLLVSLIDIAIRGKCYFSNK